MKLIIALHLFVLSSFSFGSDKVLIPAGSFQPMYGSEKNQSEFKVKSFHLDKYPVSESDYLKFLNENISYERGNINSVFADKNYLKDFIGYKKNKKPVTFVSWFAANAYCSWKRGRLPSTLEWEYVAAASENKRNASNDPEFISDLLNWYSKPLGDLEKLIIGLGHANWYGVYDMHSLVWEWTNDFNSVFITSDNRQDGDKEKGLFCGGSSIGAKSKEDYAAFVRYSLRGSLEARYTVSNLGFRCAYDK